SNFTPLNHCEICDIKFNPETEEHCCECKNIVNKNRWECEYKYKLDNNKIISYCKICNRFYNQENFLHCCKCKKIISKNEIECKICGYVCDKNLKKNIDHCCGCKMNWNDKNENHCCECKMNWN